MLDDVAPGERQLLRIFCVANRAAAGGKQVESLSLKQPRWERISCGDKTTARSGLRPFHPEALIRSSQFGVGIVIIYSDDLEYGPSGPEK